MTSLLLPPAATHPKAPFDLGVIGAGLAFAESLGGLAEALLAGAPAGTAVVQAPPGTGKTTLVPPLLANLAAGAASGLAGGAGAGRRGRRPRVVVTQPRRVAARSAARRLAALDGSRLGDRIGFTVRGERQTGPDMLIEFVTPGILMQRLLADPGLETVHAVILDEVHERGLETDLLLGMLAEVRELRGDLMLVAMSATLDAPRFAALIGSAAGNQRRRGPGSRRRLSFRVVPTGNCLGTRGGAAAGYPGSDPCLPGPCGGHGHGKARRGARSGCRGGRTRVRSGGTGGVARRRPPPWPVRR